MSMREKTVLSLLTREPMTAQDVYERFPPGRDRPPSYRSILLDLVHLAENGKIRRIDFGVYARH